jgi:hypothetical protein
MLSRLGSCAFSPRANHVEPDVRSAADQTADDRAEQ